MPGFLQLINRMEHFVVWVGRTVAWLVPLIALLVCLDAGARYFLHRGSIAIQELEWHLFAAVFLLGSAYTLQHDEHVRVDLLYRSGWCTDRTRAWIDLVGTIVLLFPFCVLVIVKSLPFVTSAFTFAEHSPDPGGLSHRWVIKAAIPVGFGLLLLQGIANVVKAIAQIVGATSTGRDTH